MTATFAQTRSFPTEIPPLYEFKDAFGIESTQLVTRVLHLDLRPLFVGNESRIFFGKFLNLAPGSGNLSFGTLDGRPSLSHLARAEKLSGKDWTSSGNGASLVRLRERQRLSRDPAPPAPSLVRGFGGGGAKAASTPQGP